MKKFSFAGVLMLAFVVWINHVFAAHGTESFPSPVCVVPVGELPQSSLRFQGSVEKNLIYRVDSTDADGFRRLKAHADPRQGTMVNGIYHPGVWFSMVRQVSLVSAAPKESVLVFGQLAGVALRGFDLHVEGQVMGIERGLFKDGTEALLSVVRFSPSADNAIRSAELQMLDPVTGKILTRIQLKYPDVNDGIRPIHTLYGGHVVLISHKSSGVIEGFELGATMQDIKTIPPYSLEGQIMVRTDRSEHPDFQELVQPTVTNRLNRYTVTVNPRPDRPPVVHRIHIASSAPAH